MLTYVRLSPQPRVIMTGRPLTNLRWNSDRPGNNHYLLRARNTVRSTRMRLGEKSLLRLYGSTGTVYSTLCNLTEYHSGSTAKITHIQVAHPQKTQEDSRYLARTHKDAHDEGRCSSPIEISENTGTALIHNSGPAHAWRDPPC